MIFISTSWLILISFFQIEQRNHENQWNATSAVRQVSERLIEQFSANERSLPRERALDIRDVAQRLLSSLAHSHMEQFDFQEPVILLAGGSHRDITGGDPGKSVW